MVWKLHNNSPEASEVFKDYDALRCIECQSIMRVPKDAFVYNCSHCNRKYEFEMVEDAETTD